MSEMSVRPVLGMHFAAETRSGVSSLDGRSSVVHSRHILRRGFIVVFLGVVTADYLGHRAEAASSAVAWTGLVNVTVADDVLQKTSGCDGCFDAGAISSQLLTAGDGYVEFTIARSEERRAGTERQA